MFSITHTLRLKNSENVFVCEVKKLDKMKKQLKDESNEDKYKKILDSLELLAEDQKITQKDLELGFIVLAKQNNELLDLNKKLEEELELVVSE